MFERKHCLRCNQVFTADRSDQMFCSKRCRINYYKEWNKKPTCTTCGCSDCEHYGRYQGKRRPRSCKL